MFHCGSSCIQQLDLWLLCFLALWRAHRWVLAAEATFAWASSSTWTCHKQMQESQLPASTPQWRSLLHSLASLGSLTGWASLQQHGHLCWRHWAEANLRCGTWCTSRVATGIRPSEISSSQFQKDKAKRVDRPLSSWVILQWFAASHVSVLDSRQMRQSSPGLYPPPLGTVTGPWTAVTILAAHYFGGASQCAGLHRAQDETFSYLGSLHGFRVSTVATF